MYYFMLENKYNFTINFSNMTKAEKLSAIHQIFSPSAPIKNIKLFAGRNNQIINIKTAVEEKGQHIIMYGKRGAGKTSLANILNQVFNNVFITKITCNRTDNYYSLWSKMTKKVKYYRSKHNIGFSSDSNAELVSMQLPAKKFIDTSDIEELFIDIQSPILLVFDEFDSVKTNETRIMMADTIKSFSDNIPNVTLLIVGIARNIIDLIGHHPSLERCVKQVKLPVMSSHEAENLIIRNLQFLGLEISRKINEKFVEYSSGFPHYIHLLCKFAAQDAITNDVNKIEQKQFDYAVEMSIKNSDHSLNTAYMLAVKSAGEKNKFKDIVYACAIAEPDESDSYTIETVLKKYNKIAEAQLKEESIRYNVGMLCRPEKGKILEKTGSARKRKYRFINPLMKAFIKLKMHKL